MRLVQENENKLRSAAAISQGDSGFPLSLYELELAAKEAQRREQEEADALMALQLAKEVFSFKRLTYMPFLFKKNRRWMLHKKQEEENMMRRTPAAQLSVVAPKPTNPGFWSCQICTFDNQAAFDRCAMCMGPKP